MTDLLETAELEAFVRAVEAGSLSRAARELGVPRATLGRRLERLEKQLGARLLRRTTRSLLVTGEGRVLYERAKEALRAIREAAESVSQEVGTVRGRLRVSLPPMQDPRVGDFVAGFLTAHPGVTIEMTFTSAAASFADDACDVALRASPQLEPSLVRRTIGTHRLVAVASPSYLAARGTPRAAAELSSHACLRGFARGEHPSSEWPTRDGVVRVDGPLSTNELVVLATAAIRGLGIALVPEGLVEEPLARGMLVKVLEDEVGTETTLAVVYPERKLVRPVVRAFVEALVAFGKAELTRPVRCPRDERCDPSPEPSRGRRRATRPDADALDSSRSVRSGSRSGRSR
ncbi:MAG: LysR family transcriptional regulator [Sandaracinus sp.]